MKRLIWLVLLVIVGLPAQGMVRAQDDEWRPFIIESNAEDLQMVADLSDEPVTAIAWNPDGTLIAAATLDDVALYDINRPRAAPIRLVGHTGIIHDLTFSAAGDWLAAAGDEGLWLYDMADQTAEARPLLYRAVNSITFFPQDDRLLSGGQDGSVYVWDVIEEDTIARANLDLPVVSVAVSPEGDELVAGAENGSYNRWDTVAYDWLGWEFKWSSSSQPGMTDLIYGPYPDRLIYGSTDGKVHMVTIGDLSAAREFTAHTAPVLHVALGWNGFILATGGARPDGCVRLWSMTFFGFNSEYHELPSYPGDVTGVAFNPAGTLLAVSSYDETRSGGDLRVWGVKE